MNGIQWKNEEGIASLYLELINSLLILLFCLLCSRCGLVCWYLKPLPVTEPFIGHIEFGILY